MALHHFNPFKIRLLALALEFVCISLGSFIE